MESSERQGPHVVKGSAADRALAAMRYIRQAGESHSGFRKESVHSRADAQLLTSRQLWAEWSTIATECARPSQSLAALYQIDWDRYFPELAAVRGVAQDPTWHPEGAVHIHLGLAADAAVAIAERDGIAGEDRCVLVLGSMLHDLGKATHSQRRADGRITAYGHAEAGVVPVRSFLTRIGASQRITDHIAAIVREHMATASTDQVSSRTVRRLQERLAGPDGGGPSLGMWAAVVEADNAGRGSGSRPSPAIPWVRKAGGA